MTLKLFKSILYVGVLKILRCVKGDVTVEGTVKAGGFEARGGGRVSADHVYTDYLHVTEGGSEKFMLDYLPADNANPERLGVVTPSGRVFEFRDDGLLKADPGVVVEEVRALRSKIYVGSRTSVVHPFARVELALAPYVAGWDAFYVSCDTEEGTCHELIGNYHGWDKEAIYIAGYNFFNPRDATNPSVSATKRVHIGKERVTIHLDTGLVETRGGLRILDESSNLRAAMNPDGSVYVGFDFKMARTVDGDFQWKRALVPWPSKLELNFDQDFAEGVRVTGLFHGGFVLSEEFDPSKLYNKTFSCSSDSGVYCTAAELNIKGNFMLYPERGAVDRVKVTVDSKTFEVTFDPGTVGPLPVTVKNYLKVEIAGSAGEKKIQLIGILW